MSASEIPIADTPSGDPIPSAPSASPSVTGPLPLSARLLAGPATLDTLAAHLHRCLQTPSGIDVVLQFVCYTTRLTAGLLDAAGKQALARQVLAVVFSGRGAAAVLVAKGSNKAAFEGAAAAQALVLAQRLRALSGLVSETRMMMRLWALLGLYFAAKPLVAQLLARLTGAHRRTSASLSEKDLARPASAPEKSPAATAVAWTQMSLLVGFQVLENGAYLASKGVLGLSPATQAWAGRWSIKLFAAYIGTELGRLAFELSTRPEARTAEAQGEVATLRKAMARNLAWAPLTLHWSSEKGLLSEVMVGLLACVPSTIQMRDLWNQTAVAKK